MSTADVAVALTLPEDVPEAIPGTKVHIIGKLDKPMPIAKGTKYIIREAGRTVAVGEMTSVTEDDINEGQRPKKAIRKGRMK